MKLTKIRLVNWHIFGNNTILINGNTIITGENGNGKSTLIDAINFVLSGGDDSNFNKSANAESKRSLASYIKGKIGGEGQEYFRNQNQVTSHIALEFTEKTGKKRVLGVILELIGERVLRYFYITDGMGVDEIPYVNLLGEVLNYDGIKKACANKIDAYPYNTPQKTIRSKIASLLQLSEDDKYKTLLERAICFKPLESDINGFINSFLLQPDNINIDGLKNEIDSYRGIKDALDRETEKLNALESFVPKGVEYLKNVDEVTYLTAIKYKKSALYNLKMKEKAALNLEAVKKELEEATLKEETETTKKEALISAKSDFDKRGELREYNSLKEKINEQTKDLNTLKDTRDKYLETLRYEQSVVDELGYEYNFLNYVESKNIDELNKALKDFSKRINHEKLLNRVKKENNYQKINEEIKNRDALVNEKEELERGKNTYHKGPKKLLDLLTINLSKNHNKDIKVLPLCECFEILDDTWSDAIEGYLGNQRFDLVVEPKYFNEALKIYDDNATKYGIYGVGLIDVTKEKDYKVEKDSLFTKIKVLNPYVETKLKQLLGRVICANNIDELTNFESSITTSCMLYKNLVAKRINPEIYKIHYIGLNSRENRLNFLTNAIKDKNNLIESLEDTNVSLDRNYKVFDRSKIHEDIIMEDVWNKILILTSSITELQNELNDLTKYKDIESLVNKLNEMSKEIEEKGRVINELKLLISIKNKESGKLENEIDKYNSNYLEYLNILDEYVIKNQLGKEYKEKEEKVLNDKNFDIDAEIRRLNSKNTRDAQSIQEGITNYYNNFDKQQGSTIDSLINFISKYNEIKEQSIVNFKQAAEKAYENAKSSFNEKFLVTLREKIHRGQDDLKKVNAILNKHPFGYDEEVYKFTWSASKDKELGAYYQILNSKKTLDEVNLFNDVMSEEDQDKIRTLFDKITTGTASDGNIDKQIEEFLDYRKYMSYDIEIKNKHNETFKFSKIAREKSGGETQTPFYVIIAACFKGLLKHNSSGSCVIIYDEAFNNMDESRIKTLLDFYKTLDDIQFLIGVPSMRTPMLIEKMDLCVGLMKEGNSVGEYYITKNEFGNERDN